MAIAGRRRVSAGFTNVTYRTVGRLVNRLAAGTDCVPPGTAMSAVPAYEDDDERWYALRTAVPPRLSHRLRRSELLHSEPRACATACVRLSRADPVGSTGRLPPFFRRLPADNGSLPHNGAYPNTPRGQIILSHFWPRHRQQTRSFRLGPASFPHGPRKDCRTMTYDFTSIMNRHGMGFDRGRRTGNRPGFAPTRHATVLTSSPCGWRT